MKPTKEEILYNHVGADGMDDGTLKAMDEFAEIYHKEKLRGELIKFAREYQGITIMAPIACVEVYLKTKE